MKLSNIVQSLRVFRKWHKYLGISLAILVVISALTGILLALKKNSDTLQPPTIDGQSTELADWKSLAELTELAQAAFYEAHPEEKGNTIDRMDVRPSKGVIKMLLKKGYWEVQIDGTTGEVLSIARRHSDWIEHVHDGSIISDNFKVVVMLLLGFGLLLMTLTGLWLWYGPKRYRKSKHQYKG